MLKRYVHIYLLLCLSLPSFAQKADYTLEHLYPISQQRPDRATPPADARIHLYCDGENLSLVAEVLDDDIRVGASIANTDHIEVWFAVSASCYPSDFEYKKHPDYIYAPIPTRGDELSNGRLFSIYSEYTDWLDLSSFRADFDYPDADQIISDSLSVPFPGQLEEIRLPFGVVGFALFPDERPAEWLMPDAYAELEELLGFRLGNPASGIRYTAETDEQTGGYIINAEISPQALGFLPVPDIRELGIFVDLADNSQRSDRVSIVRSSVPDREVLRPSSFEMVSLATPLYTNYSGISDDFFYQEDWEGMLVIGEYTWHAVEIETDALVYQSTQTSHSLMEVQFQPVILNHNSRLRYDSKVEELRFQRNFINAQPQVHHQFLIGHHLLRTQQVPEEDAEIVDSMFVFPDITPGMILHGFTPMDPYGWSDCGDCVEEQYDIYRIESEQAIKLLSVSQSLEAPYYCEIGESLSYSKYFIESFDWVYPGEVLVFRLNHRTEPKEKKRVKVSWAEDGSDVRVEEY